MENNLADSILSVCKVLNKYAVQYIIVGGTAVALHDYFRQSMNLAGTVANKPDLDFWSRWFSDGSGFLRAMVGRLLAAEARGHNHAEEAGHPRRGGLPARADPRRSGGGRPRKTFSPPSRHRYPSRCRVDPRPAGLLRFLGRHRPPSALVRHRGTMAGDDGAVVQRSTRVLHTLPIYSHTGYTG